MKATIVKLITVLISKLLSEDVWKVIVTAVNQEESTTRSGEEKRAAVYTTVSALATTTATWLLNLAIEAAVAKIKA